MRRYWRLFRVYLYYRIGETACAVMYWKWCHGFWRPYQYFMSKSYQLDRDNELWKVVHD